MTDLSVVIPTYGRPTELVRCLAALGQQELLVNEIVVVRRSDDRDTGDVLAGSRIRLTEVIIEEAGLLAALRAGVARAAGDVVAFIDDDAAAHPAWSSRIAAWLATPGVGGVGGRDVVRRPEQPDKAVTDGGLTPRVGRITASGRMIANHHRGTGPAQQVSVLKGVNMAFRRDALALPVHLRGQGAVVHWEVATCLWAIQRGWKLIYDPELLVDHFPAPRPAGDHRASPEQAAVEDATYNYAMALLSMRRYLLAGRVLDGMLVGDRASPGLLRALISAISGEREISRRLIPSVRGQLRAYFKIAAGQRVPMMPALASKRAEAVEA